MSTEAPPMDDRDCPDYIWVGGRTESSGAPGELPGIIVTTCELQDQKQHTLNFIVVTETHTLCKYDPDCSGSRSGWIHLGQALERK